MGRRSQYSFSKRQRELRKKKKKQEKLAKKHGGSEDEENEEEVVEEEAPSEPEVVSLDDFVDGYTPEAESTASEDEESGKKD